VRGPSPRHTGAVSGSRALEEVAAAAVALQDDAELVIAWSCSRAPKTAELARRGGAVVRAFAQLREELEDAPPGPDRDRVRRLLAHHEQVVEQALRLAFRPDSPARDRIAGHLRSGLGEPAAQLRSLAAGLGAAARARRWLGAS
jgi:hypothetical protein